MRGRKPVIKPLGEDDVVDLPSARERVPDPPSMLTGRAKKLWPSVVAELVARNIYDGDCRDAVVSYCIQFAKFLDAEEDIATNGKVIDRVNPRGIAYDADNPAIKQSDAACSLMLRLAGELGLTATSRKRVVKIRSRTTIPAQQFLKRA